MVKSVILSFIIDKNDENGITHLGLRTFLMKDRL